MLKKQTVWLLTMLSLLIVLSVYYMTSPNGDELAFINDNAEENGTSTTAGDSKDTKDSGESGDAGSDEEGEADVTTEPADVDELFASIRMQTTDQRSEAKTRLEEIVASSSTSTEEKNEAVNQIELMEQFASKESILEESIIAEKGYEEVLVRAEEGHVQITVKTDKMTAQEANSIMQMASDEFAGANVDVKYIPQK
ncbi:stage III sporulation protein AH [Terribacillus halophilus]|uniref:Stage III sporulation protein AH n=1 Tax=Terribacillus halophilus TaxID=361279 RepID=A0A1G6VLQ5_9BACI|nr:SpoIIIAH-like family protein [Terribacillus halophilus]SDD54570.1 stage III sporulation protein AH [Terribacillus halophilus]